MTFTQSGAQSGAQSRAQSGAPSELVLSALARKPLSMNELTETVGLKSKTGSLKRSVNALLDEKLVEYTISDKPGSRLQQYRLTPAGRQSLEENAT